MNFGMAFQIVDDFYQSTTTLDGVINTFRQLGEQTYIIRSLLTRAGLRRVTGALENAKYDLDEAFSIALRTGMCLHEVDCHLEYAKLYLGLSNKEQARESLRKAEKMIRDMGYHKLDKEIDDLRIKLNPHNKRNNNLLKTDPASGTD